MWKLWTNSVQSCVSVSITPAQSMLCTRTLSPYRQATSLAARESSCRGGALLQELRLCGGYAFGFGFLSDWPHGKLTVPVEKSVLPPARNCM